MKYFKLFENFYEEEFYYKMSEFNEDDYHPTAVEYANKYYRDEKNPRGAYGDYFEIVDRLDDFCTTDFPYGIQNIPNPVKLYRLLNVESEEAINKEELGKHFVGDKDMFDDYDFVESFLHRYGEETKRWFIVTIETTKDNLDMGQILGNRAEYPNEYEFTVKDDKNLNIVEIEEKEPW
jgi:hypothetical protein